MGDGNGWARCGRGHVHWGKHGAAGLLLYHRDPEGEVKILLQQRAWWCHGGGTWGMFGGGRDSHEDAVTAALREVGEECTLDTTSLKIHGVRTDDHGGWDFAAVIASADRMATVRPASMETRRAAWVAHDEVADLRLFAPFESSWPRLGSEMSQLILVVDAANVVGSRADGWWRDRAGANARLRDQLAGLAGEGVTGVPVPVLPYDRAFPEIVLVVEGAARSVAGEQVDGVRVVAAPGSGDDAIVDLVSKPEPDTVHLVVTADRELRDRVTGAGAHVVGPRWLLDRLG